MTEDAPFSLDQIFEAQYARIARVIRRVIRDPGRAEELAVEVFLRWSHTPVARGSKAEGWLYRTAARIAIDELRRQDRRSRLERVLSLVTQRTPTPEDVRSATEEQDRVRAVLRVIPARDAEMLLLRSQGLDYNELAAALDLSPSSVGSLLSRAQQKFKKEYVERYGEQ